LGQAESYISGVISAAPRSHEARAILAEIRMRQGRADDVAAILEPILDSAGSEVRALAVRASMQAGQHNTSINYLREQLANNPDNPDLQIQLAAALVVAGQHDAAQAILAEIKIKTGESEIQRDMIRIYSLLGRAKSDDALRQAIALAERFPDDPRAHNLLGNVALVLGRVEQARNSLARAQELLPTSLPAYLNIAAIDIQQGDFDAARGQLTAALELAPDSPDIMVSLARLEGYAGDKGAARRWLEQARDTAPRDMTPHIFLTRFLLSENDAEGAEAVARDALAIDANEPAAINLLGLALEGQGKLAEAIPQFERALQLAPEQRQYQSNMTRVLMASGDFAKAEQVLTGSGGVNLDDIEQASMVAALRARQNDLNGALEIAESLKQRHPGNGAPFAIEAELLSADGQYAKASDSYDQALMLSGADRSLALRAFVVRNRGRIPNPEQPLLAYLRQQPEDAEVRWNAAISFLSRGETSKAIEHFELALKDAPNDVGVLTGLAQALIETGDNQRAAKLLEQALAESPDYEGRDEVERLLESLKN
jgi:putative PEP-CTERM system TPR-repeat lipoprotein